MPLELSRAVTLLAASFLFFDSIPLRAQSSVPSEPFTAVQNEKGIETSAEQSRRLQRIRDLPSTKWVQIFRMKESVPIGDTVKITIPHEGTLVFSKTGGETRDAKDFSWFGVVHKGGPGTATLVARNGEITGSISTPEGVYRLSSLGEGLYAMAKMDAQRMPPDEPPRKNKER